MPLPSKKQMREFMRLTDMRIVSAEWYKEFFEIKAELERIKGLGWMGRLKFLLTKKT